MSEPFLGEVRAFSMNFVPRGWAACQGQLLPINQYQALFSLLGTMYGGDGRVNFALPDLRGRAAVHPGDGLVQGASLGEEDHTLAQAEMPQHTHTFAASSHRSRTEDPEGAVWAASDQNQFSGGSGVPMHAASTSSSGGSQAHPNMQPYLVLTYAIATSGIFPSRD